MTYPSGQIKSTSNAESLNAVVDLAITLRIHYQLNFCLSNFSVCLPDCWQGIDYREVASVAFLQERSDHGLNFGVLTSLWPFEKLGLFKLWILGTEFLELSDLWLELNNLLLEHLFFLQILKAVAFHCSTRTLLALKPIDFSLSNCQVSLQI